jgi:hypothetical protein
VPPRGVAIERSLSAFAIPFADGNDEPEDVGERLLLDKSLRVVWILGAAHGSMLS